MKLSKMTTDQAADVLVQIAQPVSNIMDDPEVEKLVSGLDKEKDKTIMRIFASLLPKVVPLALKSHREDFFEIVGALEHKTASDVKKWPLTKTMSVLRDSVDKDLIDFFGFTANQETTEEAE